MHLFFEVNSYDDFAPFFLVAGHMCARRIHVFVPAFVYVYVCALTGCKIALTGNSRPMLCTFRLLFV